MSNERDGLCVRGGIGGNGRGSLDFRRCCRRMCDLRLNSASFVFEGMGSYASDNGKVGNDMLEDPDKLEGGEASSDSMLLDEPLLELTGRGPCNKELGR